MQLLQHLQTIDGMMKNSQNRKVNPEAFTHMVMPWRDSTNEERLDGENGLLLTPSIDHLFDRGFIGFENNGKLIISPVAHRPSLVRMGVETEQIVNVGRFSSGQKQFLDFHRNSVFLESRRY